jgi:hypothetical protein
VVGDGDLPGYTAVRTLSRTTSRGCGFSGLATRGFGAWTVMLGSEVPPDGVWVCAIAVPLKPHNNAVDRIATAEGATRLDDILMRRFPKSGH